MNDSNQPAFYITKTLLGFGPGEPDLNRVMLEMPFGTFVLCEMNESRSEKDYKRWHELAAALSKNWDKHGQS